MNQSVPWWAYIFAVPIIIVAAKTWIESARPGVKVRRYKIVDGYKVRDYQAEQDHRR